MEDILKLSEDGKTVIGVKDKTITHITIPNSVTTIEVGAFEGCSSLHSIYIPNSVKTIGEWAFWDCSSLHSINIPNSVKTIRNSAFSHCSSLHSINIPNSVTTIGKWVFRDCSSLHSIDIPSSVTTIGYQAFLGCSSLHSIIIAEENKHYASIDGVLFSKELTTIIKLPAGEKITEYNIPNSVTTIEDGAFEDCSSLHSINIPNSVKTIEDEAFEGCSSLHSIHISITDIENVNISEYAFDGIDTDNCVLYVPLGTRLAYGLHPVFSKFKNIEIEKQK